MEHVVTICCKRKRRSPEPLPAVHRYLSRRIRFVRAESMRVNRPFLILSGQYGLVSPDAPIPWYDRVLRASEVDTLVTLVSRQLTEHGVTEMVFFARPRSTAGWAPYFAVLEQACSHRKVTLNIRHLDPSFL